MFVRLLDPRTGALLREHLSGKRGGHRIRDADRPRRTLPPLLQLLARAHKAGANISAVQRLLSLCGRSIRSSAN